MPEDLQEYPQHFFNTSIKTAKYANVECQLKKTSANGYKTL